MMELVIGFYEQSNEALNNGADVEKLIKMPVREAIGRFKYTHENDLDEEFDRINDQLSTQIANTLKKEEF